MNKQQIQAELKNQLAGGSTDRLQLSLKHGTGRCEIEVAGSLACSLNWVEYSSNALDRLADSELRGFAEQLASRLTYLLEPIRTIEADPDVVQMRSQPPTRDATDGSRSYFELLARAGRLHLMRYHKQAGEPREATPMQLTHEVVAQLFIDFELAVEALNTAGTKQSSDEVPF